MSDTTDSQILFLFCKILPCPWTKIVGLQNRKEKAKVIYVGDWLSSALIYAMCLNIMQKVQEWQQLWQFEKSFGCYYKFQINCFFQHSKRDFLQYNSNLRSLLAAISSQTIASTTHLTLTLLSGPAQTSPCSLKPLSMYNITYPTECVFSTGLEPVAR
jgi:hypothetical protein